MQLAERARGEKESVYHAVPCVEAVAMPVEVELAFNATQPRNAADAAARKSIRAGATRIKPTPAPPAMRTRLLAQG